MDQEPAGQAQIVIHRTTTAHCNTRKPGNPWQNREKCNTPQKSSGWQIGVNVVFVFGQMSLETEEKEGSPLRQ
jgi:hypothetical protein